MRPLRKWTSMLLIITRRLDDGKSEPKQDDVAPAKKVKAHARNLPIGTSLKDNSGGGDCLFHAFADCLVAQGRSARTAAELRKLCVTHIRKHAKSYEGYWRGDAPDAQGTPIRDQGFEEYMRLLAKAGAWGGSIEIAALANTLAQPVFVFRPVDDDIRVFQGTAKGTPTCLWYEARHYQALIGSAPPDELKKATPASHWRRSALLRMSPLILCRVAVMRGIMLLLSGATIASDIMVDVDALGPFGLVAEQTGAVMTATFATMNVGRAVVLKGVDCQSRFVAALFEFKGAQGPGKILVAATYGHASDPTSATEHAIQMTIELARSGNEWVLVGDFNVDVE
ncbi:otu2, partial [Symbiodinium microadriaticum]